MVKNYNDLTQEQKIQVFKIWQIEALKDQNMDPDIDRYNFNEFNESASLSNSEYIFSNDGKKLLATCG